MDNGERKGRHDPAVCARSPEGQPYPGLHQRCMPSRSREVILPLCSGGTSPGVLHPALELPAQEGHGDVGAGAE